MSKYIDLELALNELLRLYEEDVDRYAVEIRCGLKIPETFDYSRAREALIDLPTIDIVHCKDCKHSEYREDFDNYLCDQLGLGSVNDADFFCSYGERKDNE